MISDNLPIAKIIDNNDSDPSMHDRMTARHLLSKDELELVKKIFKFKMKTETKQASLSWLLNFEPYCYCEDQIKKELL